MLRQWICATTGGVLFTPKGRAWNRDGPLLGTTGNTALLSLMYGQSRSSQLAQAKRDRYTCFARSQMRYLLGDGGRSLMVGFGKKWPQSVQNRAASCPPSNCTRVCSLVLTLPPVLCL
jgi:endoglucanase